MAHISYYGEDEAPQYTTHKKGNKMIFNFDQLIQHNKRFTDAFIDLKVTGWKSYSSALDAYTFGYFKRQLKEMDANVEKLGIMMKGDKE